MYGPKRGFKLAPGETDLKQMRLFILLVTVCALARPVLAETTLEKVRNRVCFSHKKRPSLEMAKQVVKAASTNPPNLDVKTFLSLWDDACEFKIALETARGVQAETADLKTFRDYYLVVLQHCEFDQAFTAAQRKLMRAPSIAEPEGENDNSGGAE